jgi:TRAP-type mannitol/chloroaromatic compound transport system substrate-binding protein
MERRRFIVKAGGVLAAAGAAAIVDAPNVIAQPKFQWRLSTSWTPALDVLQGGAQQLAKIVDEMSGGRLKIQVFTAGELMPAFGNFDATSQGTIESYMSAPYYFAGKEPAFQWFSAVPFSFNPQAQMAWYLDGGGLKLWEEAYSAFNLVPRPGPSTGVQMAGWFRKKINSIADYKGLKMRIPGLGGKIVAAAGGTVVLTPGGEIYTALERGVIDSAEWVGPHDDMKLGLHNAARYYTWPGWHEPGTTAEFSFNKKTYDALPADLRAIIDYGCRSIQVSSLMEYEYKNTVALQKLKTEFKSKVELTQLSTATLKELKKLSDQVLKEESEKTPMAKKVYASVKKFESQLSDWRLISEAAYHSQVASV